MRLAVFILAGLQVALLIAFAAFGTGGSDAAGNAMSAGFVTLGGIVMAVFLVPALILAISGRAGRVALVLAILPLVIVTIGLTQL